jgi:type I restriction enzyme M protein
MPRKDDDMNAQSLVAKVWNFAHVLRDQGVSYQAYISQISYLLFLKMDEERVSQIGEASMLPDGARWSDIKDLSGEALNATYVKLLDKLSKQGGIIGAIFLKAQNEIQDPAKLKRLVGLIDSGSGSASPWTSRAISMRACSPATPRT